MIILLISIDNNKHSDNNNDNNDNNNDNITFHVFFNLALITHKESEKKDSNRRGCIDWMFGMKRWLLQSVPGAKLVKHQQVLLRDTWIPSLKLTDIAPENA